MIKRLFNSQSKTITSAAVVLAAASLASRFLGLLRDRILAGQFGAGDELDVYFAAFRIPDLIYNLLVVGALAAGFIPVFTSYLQKQKKQSFNSTRSVLVKFHEDRPRGNGMLIGEAWSLANNVLNIIGLGLIIVCGIAAVFAKEIVPLITPGFNPEKIGLTVNLTRIIFLSPIFLGISGVLSGVLQSFKNFLTFALAPIFYNLGIIFGAVFLTRYFGIYGLGLGVIIGAFLHMSIQIPPAIAHGFRYRAIFNFKQEGVRRIARLMLPRTLSLGVSQLNFLAMTFIASTLAAGSIAIFNFAYNIYTLPFGIVAVSYAVAVFPALSEAAAKKDWEEYAKNFSSTFRQILFFIIPATAFLMVLRAQVVRVILGSGEFNWNDTILTINTLQYLVLGLFADSLIMLLVRGFFAVEDTKTPAVITFLGTLLRLGLAYWLVRYFGVAGLALGYAIGGIASMALLWIFLEEKIGDLRQNEIILAGFKILLSSALAGLAAYGTLYFMATVVDMRTFTGILEQGLAAGLVGIAVYVVVGLLLKSQEMFSFWQAITNRLPWAKVAPEEEIID